MEDYPLVIKPTEEEMKLGKKLRFYSFLCLILSIVFTVLIVYYIARRIYGFNALIAGCLSFVTSIVNSWLGSKGNRLLATKLSSTIDEMSPDEFKVFVADLFERMGYRSKYLKNSGEYGVDVIAEGENERVAVQIEHSPLGGEVIWTTIKAVPDGSKVYDANKAMVITTAFFTRLARDRAKKLGVELVNRRELTKLVEKHFSK